MYKIPASDNLSRSGPHRAMENILDRMGVSYLSEQQFPPFTVDIYIPEWHFAIEIDGPFHSRHKDDVRDKYLMVHYGLPVQHVVIRLVRFTKIESWIKTFIEEYEPTTWDRKQIWLTTR